MRQKIGSRNGDLEVLKEKEYEESDDKDTEEI